MAVKKQVRPERSIVRRKSTQYRFEIGLEEYAGFITAVQDGMSIDSAAWSIGKDPSTVRTWLGKGEIFFNSIDDLVTHSAAWQYARFYQDFKKAGSNFEYENLLNIKEHGHKDKNGVWVASAWLLERKMPEQYSHKYIIDRLVDRRLTDILKMVYELLTPAAAEQFASILHLIPGLKVTQD